MSETTISTNKAEVSLWEKAWKAISHPEQIKVIIWFGFVVFFGMTFWIITIFGAKASVSVPVVLKGEVFSNVYGNGDHLYAVAVVEQPLESGATVISNQELTWLYYNLRAKVTGECSAQSAKAEQLYGYGIEVTIYLYESQQVTEPQLHSEEFVAELATLCVDPNTSIVAGPLEDSFFDGVSINGYQEDSWNEVMVPPYYVPEAKMEPVKKENNK